MNDTFAAIETERIALADELETLTLEQWDAPSLCAEWKVRDVVAHVVMGAEKHSFGSMLVDMAKHGFNFNKAMAKMAVEAGNQPPHDLLKQLREHADARVTPPMSKPIHVLCDVIIHSQDIRRPLGRTRSFPAESLVAALESSAGIGPIMGNKKRIAGLKLVASDVDWSHGEGPEVRGTGEALLMAMNGRKDAIADLTGDGVATLRNR
jgi:uncharacterized protein (TIGR03083 family)